MSHFWHHIAHAARHADERGNHKVAGLAYVVIGLFFAPMLIGIPVLMYGIYKLSK